MNSDLVNAIQFDEEQVDIESIMGQIRQYLAQTHGTPVALPIDRPQSIMLDREVYDELFEANQEFDKGRVTPYLTPVRVPLIGKLWQGLRWRLHSLVTFYVDRAADAQIRFNTHTIRVLNGIVRGIDLDQTPERVDRLERRVTELEQRLQASASQVERGVGPAATQEKS
jgi:hypothetical protein